MQKKASKKGFLLFLAVFLATGLVILGLSMATRTNPYQTMTPSQKEAVQVEHAQDTEALSASPPKEEKNMLHSVGAFLLLVTIPAGYVGFLAVKYAQNPGKLYRQGRKYNPRSEITFKTLAANTRGFKF